jgi:selenocysteine-specific elongation factor
MQQNVSAERTQGDHLRDTIARYRHMKVIGTAGHIDHGKSALVRRLTGTDPDRLAEEKRRGMTIDLGFAHLTLPSGTELSIVDVPGHERFVKNMLAGAGGLEAALLVVAADEGVMPQTREHLDILDLLEVRHGVVALSKVDLADEDLRAIVTDDIQETLRGTSLSGIPIVPVSSKTGEGVPALLSALDAALDATPASPDLGLPFLSVDRVFTAEGFGTVVTGTLHDGSLVVGQEVEILPGRRRARIRALQAHGSEVDSASPGQRIAINLAGAEKSILRRGSMVAMPRTVFESTSLTVVLRAVQGAARVTDGMEVAVHVGAAQHSAVVHLVRRRELTPGESAVARLHLREAVPALRGQRLVVRLPSPVGTIAGGYVLVPPSGDGRLRIPEPDFHSFLSGSEVEAAAALVRRWSPMSPQALRLAMRLSASACDSVVDFAIAEGEIVRIGPDLVGKAPWERTVDRARTTLLAFHAANPLRSGMPKEELRARLHWSRESWPQALRLLVDEGVLADLGQQVARPGHAARKREHDEERERVLSLLRGNAYSPPAGSDLLTQAGVDEEFLRALNQSGDIVHVGGGMYFDRDAFASLRATVLQLIDRDGKVTVGSLRDSTGTSRKYAVPLLEYLDAQHVTRRSGDARVRGSKAPVCA